MNIYNNTNRQLSCANQTPALNTSWAKISKKFFSLIKDGTNSITKGAINLLKAPVVLAIVHTGMISMGEDPGD